MAATYRIRRVKDAVTKHFTVLDSQIAAWGNLNVLDNITQLPIEVGAKCRPNSKPGKYVED